MERKKLVTMKSVGGLNMIKISEFHKNGKPLTGAYTFPGDFQKKIDKKIAACKIEMDKFLPKMMTLIGTLTRKSDRDEMYELIIDDLKKKTEELETFKNMLDMVPPPMSESGRQISNFLISHHKSDIAQLKKTMELQ